MDASDVRQLVAEYLDRVRLFYDALMSVDSGLSPTVHPATLFKQPDSLLQAENDFINDLLSLLNDMNKALEFTERWLIHLDNLATNLRLKPQEKSDVLTRDRSALAIIKQQDYRDRFADDELPYLRWVTVDTAEELELLLVETRQLDVADTTLPSRIRQFKAPFFEWFELSTAVGRSLNISKLATNLQIYLDQAVAGTFEDAINQLAKYLDEGIALLNRFVTLDKKSGTFSPTWLLNTKQLLHQLLQAGVKLHEFVVQRTQMAFLLFEHELAIIQAILPPDTSPPDWYMTFMTNSNESALDLLPTELRYDTLSYAIKQAEQALISAEARIQEGERLLTEAEIMQEILQSPIVTNFFDADRGRLMIFETWHPELQNRLHQIRKVLETTDSLGSS